MKEMMPHDMGNNFYSIDIFWCYGNRYTYRIQTKKGGKTWKKQLNY